jgi:Ca2+-binding RTX toxin-like protein
MSSSYSSRNAETVQVLGTPASSSTFIATGAASDDVAVATTGAGSILVVSTGAGDDTLDVSTTGAGSVTLAALADGRDTLQILTTGDRSGTLISAQAGEDLLLLDSTGVDSATRLDGGTDNDQFQVAYQTRSLSALRGHLEVNGQQQSPAPALSVLSRGLVVDSRTNQPQRAPWNRFARFTTESAVESMGDTVVVYDNEYSGAVETEYELFSNASATMDGSLILVRENALPVWSEAIETFELQVTARDSVVELFWDAQRQRLPAVMRFEGTGGNNRLDVVGTTSNDTILVGPIGGDQTGSYPIQLDAFSSLRVFGLDGDDVVVNGTERPVAQSLLAGGDGNDILVGGKQTDVLFGGRGMDALFGNLGDDFLFGDTQLDGTTFIEAGDVLFGNQGELNDPGAFDQAATLVPPNSDFTDHVDEVENLIEEGAEKGVWSWLTASFPSFSLVIHPDGTVVSLELSQLRQEALRVVGAVNVTVPGRDLEAFQQTLSFTAPSVIEYSPSDVNQDRYVSAIDALLIINRLNDNSGASRAVGTKDRLDVSGDGIVSPRDALLVINVLNAIAANNPTPVPSIALQASAVDLAIAADMIEAKKKLPIAN